MGARQVPCQSKAVEEYRAELESLSQDTFVILIGDNNNILGLGFVEDVDQATATLVVPVIPEVVPVELTFVPNLCCVCSKIELDFGDLGTPANREFVAQILALLGLIDAAQIPG